MKKHIVFKTLLFSGVLALCPNTTIEAASDVDKDPQLLVNQGALKINNSFQYAREKVKYIREIRYRFDTIAIPFIKKYAPELMHSEERQNLDPFIKIVGQSIGGFAHRSTIGDFVDHLLTQWPVDGSKIKKAVDKNIKGERVVLIEDIKSETEKALLETCISKEAIPSVCELVSPQIWYHGDSAFKQLTQEFLTQDSLSVKEIINRANYLELNTPIPIEHLERFSDSWFVSRSEKDRKSHYQKSKKALEGKTAFCLQDFRQIHGLGDQERRIVSNPITLKLNNMFKEKSIHADEVQECMDILLYSGVVVVKSAENSLTDFNKIHFKGGQLEYSGKRFPEAFLRVSGANHGSQEALGASFWIITKINTKIRSKVEEMEQNMIGENISITEKKKMQKDIEKIKENWLEYNGWGTNLSAQKTRSYPFDILVSGERPFLPEKTLRTRSKTPDFSGQSIKKE